MSYIVMNLVATHSNCTSPMDYISHHALHSHIPVHHYTNHTAVTIHSLVLIVSPHLHLIHSHTFKQHSHMHSLRSLVLGNVFLCGPLKCDLNFKLWNCVKRGQGEVFIKVIFFHKRISRKNIKHTRKMSNGCFSL